ncbi:MAG: Crp/Fnr family transcriptional regulator [Peptococcaceae bacterium]|nr:Crp/Fnr family transcriptional regulator [Peptococcaceae bacterium]
MSEQTFFPIISGELSTAFPELKQFILTNYSSTQTVKRGAEINFTDERMMLYLAKGKIKSYACDEEGHERLMYIYIKDTIIFHSVSEQFSKNLVALEAASVYSVDEDRVFEFLQQDARYIKQYAKLIASRYGILMQQILTTNHQNARHKVYDFILALAKNYGILQPDRTIRIAKHPTLTDIASITNVHRSNVTAYINELESDGIIRRDKRQLTIIDLDALRQRLRETGA